MRSLFARAVLDDSGQDLIEYALLAAFIGVVGIVAWQAVAGGIGDAYLSWDGGVQDISGCTPDPGGGGC